MTQAESAKWAIDVAKIFWHSKQAVAHITKKQMPLVSMVGGHRIYMFGDGSGLEEGNQRTWTVPQIRAINNWTIRRLSW